jgi:hypothetical protein
MTENKCFNSTYKVGLLSIIFFLCTATVSMIIELNTKLHHYEDPYRVKYINKILKLEKDGNIILTELYNELYTTLQNSKETIKKLEKNVNIANNNLEYAIYNTNPPFYYYLFYNYDNKTIAKLFNNVEKARNDKYREQIILIKNQEYYLNSIQNLGEIFRKTRDNIIKKINDSMKLVTNEYCIEEIKSINIKIHESRDKFCKKYNNSELIQFNNISKIYE